MLKRLSSFLLLNSSLLLVSGGCGRASVVRAPTRVVEEEPEQPTVVVTRASSAEEDPPAQTKDAPAPAETVAFGFPADRGGELLSRELTLAATRPLAEPAPKPRRGKVPGHLEWPDLPLPPGLAEHTLPSRAAPARKSIVPRLATPEMLFDLALEVALPQAVPMPGGARTKEAGVDVTKPAPLPILGQPVPDRASLADATADASGAAVVAGTMPVRRRTVPFLRLGLPDPFENYRPLRVPVPPESTDPVTASPRVP
jgi:hypothetical protein